MTQFESFSSQLINTLDILQKQLDDISLKQVDLHNQITSARSDSITEEEYADVKAMMDTTLAYKSKLLSLRTTMVNMSLKSKQLLKRSDKLKATKMDYLSKVEDIRKREQERDQSIAAIVLEPSTSIHTTQPNTPTRSSSPMIPSSLLEKSVDDDNKNNKAENEQQQVLSPAPVTTTTTTDSILGLNDNKGSPVISPIGRTSSTSSLSTTTATTPVVASDSSSKVIGLAKTKKKKKPKAREVEIGGDDDNRAWTPKRTLSSSIGKKS
ncbi:uncharacterized protein BX664DRAFT_340604 [Halteromyces radiatus]|uniref:uncharacterized protein n=1 Tax=Halteromyces radiatus TaxID=101107 RepID=UPI002220237D|nr:uncharacterized protein BX664DRAFT_340604 [Halteromyces radiatus]KAI8081517.1 hypothetical protein BX664DRAFT_340604 [Halteromyces radiatus]